VGLGSLEGGGSVGMARCSFTSSGSHHGPPSPLTCAIVSSLYGMSFGAMVTAASLGSMAHIGASYSNDGRGESGWFDMQWREVRWGLCEDANFVGNWTMPRRIVRLAVRTGQTFFS
jgi:hypothetical protein